MKALILTLYLVPVVTLVAAGYQANASRCDRMVALVHTDTDAELFDRACPTWEPATQEQDQ